MGEETVLFLQLFVNIKLAKINSLLIKIVGADIEGLHKVKANGTFQRQSIKSYLERKKEKHFQNLRIILWG